ncbi:tyrosine-type recombinase/integrase [Arthrobacter sp. SO3]|uniref:tyrosine-type recombinase/integrase n=1 Tax=Arthrobacter sp. SO3 TaxID=1897057 RepID=UPI001CFF6B7F|nr:tyrosine-type recombinase/integrase [Arthrobacter sp. SO3]MCB5292842.1 Tyrosine recombinase XerH [Arthrobacter sp. SO3]
MSGALNTPARKTNGKYVVRTDATIGLWMTPLRSFYEWADSGGLLKSDIAAKITQVKYFAPGTPAGGEHGARRRVIAEDLRPTTSVKPRHPEWIDSASARQRLETIPLHKRDRFLIDLMYYTGIRAGEALSLFTGDLHFGGGSRTLNCNKVDPHFHVRGDNKTENGARAKGRPRLLFVNERLIEGYIDYLLERNAVLGNGDKSAHVFVNLYSAGNAQGRAMSYSGVKKLTRRCGDKIGFALSGPHILRHTLATRLVRGVDCTAQPLDVVQEILGHASINSTRVYTHGQEEASKAAMESLATRTVILGENS